MTRRTRVAAASGAVVLAAATVGVVLVDGSGSGGSAKGASPTKGGKLTTITRRDLVETDSEDGTLGFSDSRSVINRLSGTVTWLPAVGTVVHPGHRLYAVDGQPVFLLDGGTPVYRALGPSTSSGHDVLALERNLRALGYDSGHAMSVDGTWDAGTTAAVERFQAAKGLDATGTLELGRVIFQPGARRVSSLDVTLGGSAGSGQAKTTGGGATAVIGILAHALQAGITSTTTTTTTTPATTTTAPVTTPTVTRTVAVTTPATTRPARTTTRPAPTTTPAATRGAGGGGGGAALRSAAGGGSTASGGGGSAAGSSGASSSGGTASPVLSTTSTRQVVSVDLDAAKQDVAHRGARVTVELPSGDTVHGRIAKVGSVATAVSGNSNSDATATLKVTVKLVRRVKALDQAPVTVDFEQSRARDVLTIPVTALLARPGGTYAVEVREGDARRVVPVTTGLFASGYVEIDGAVRAGERVTDSGIA